VPKSVHQARGRPCCHGCATVAHRSDCTVIFHPRAPPATPALSQRCLTCLPTPSAYAAPIVGSSKPLAIAAASLATDEHPSSIQQTPMCVPVFPAQRRCREMLTGAIPGRGPLEAAQMPPTPPWSTTARAPPPLRV
jgi:hypothetical protein